MSNCQFALGGTTEIYDWLNGKKTPQVETLAKLAEYFGCTIDYLLGR